MRAIPLALAVVMISVFPVASSACVVYACAEPDVSGSGAETWWACAPGAVMLCTERGVGSDGWTGCEAQGGESRNTYVWTGAAHLGVVAGIYERCDQGQWDAWDIYVNYNDGNNDVHQAGIFWYATDGYCATHYYAYRHPVLSDGWGPAGCPAGQPPPVLP